PAGSMRPRRPPASPRSTTPSSASWSMRRCVPPSARQSGPAPRRAWSATPAFCRCCARVPPFPEGISQPMSTEIKVPKLPESVADATLVNWHKEPGEAVARDENLADLETDKVVLEVPAPVAGVLKEIKVQAGATVQ